MNDKMTLLNKIRTCDFILTELRLYLDSHPDCAAALERYRLHLGELQSALAEYASKFGPLNPYQAGNGESWNWTQGPWPWEKEE